MCQSRLLSYEYFTQKKFLVGCIRRQEFDCFYLAKSGQKIGPTLYITFQRNASFHWPQPSARDRQSQGVATYISILLAIDFCSYYAINHHRIFILNRLYLLYISYDIYDLNRSKICSPALTLFDRNPIQNIISMPFGPTALRKSLISCTVLELYKIYLFVKSPKKVGIPL